MSRGRLEPGVVRKAAKLRAPYAADELRSHAAALGLPLKRLFADGGGQDEWDRDATAAKRPATG